MIFHGYERFYLRSARSRAAAPSAETQSVLGLAGQDLVLLKPSLVRELSTGIEWIAERDQRGALRVEEFTRDRPNVVGRGREHRGFGSREPIGREPRRIELGERIGQPRGGGLQLRR